MIAFNERMPSGEAKVILAWELPARVGTSVLCPREFNFNRFGETADLCRVLVDFMYFATQRNDDHNPQGDDTDQSVPVAMHSKFLSNLLGKSYTNVIADCKAAGLIVVAHGGTYTPGESAKHYQLGESFRHHNWHSVQLRDARLIERRRKRVRSDLASMPEPYRWASQFDLDLQFDPPPSKALLKRLAKQKGDNRSRVERRVQMYENQIRDIVLGMTAPIIDKYGRRHSALTRLKKEFREYLRYDGESLTSVDITNSQPTFWGYQMQVDLRANVAVFLSKALGVDPADLHETLDADQQRELAAVLCSEYEDWDDWSRKLCREAVAFRELLGAYDEMPGVPDHLDWREPDTWSEPSDHAARIIGSVGEWAAAAERGEIYELLNGGGFRNEKERKVFKYGEFFPVLYGPCLRPLKVWGAIQERFPGPAEYMRHHKQIDLLAAKRDELEVKYGHRYWPRFESRYKDFWARMAREMQSREAEFVFGAWVSELMARGVPCTTIHDEVVVMTKHEQMARDVLRAEANKAGIRMACK